MILPVFAAGIIAGSLLVKESKWASRVYDSLRAKLVAFVHRSDQGKAPEPNEAEPTA